MELQSDPPRALRLPAPADPVDLFQQEARELFALVQAALIEAPDSTGSYIGGAIRHDLGPLVEPATAIAPAAERSGWQIRLECENEVLGNGSRPLDLLDDLRKLGACFVTASIDGMSLDERETDDCFLNWNITLHGDCDRAAIDDVFAFVQDEIKLDCVPLGGPKVATLLPAWIEASAPQTRRLGLYRTSGLASFAGKSRQEIVVPNPERIRS